MQPQRENPTNFSRGSVKVRYTPYKDNLYQMRMVMRLQSNPSFRNVFKYDLTTHFINDMKNIVSPDRKFTQNTVINLSGQTGCQPKGSKVLLANGDWKNIEDVAIGDLILSPQHNGSCLFAPVVKTFKWQSKENYSVSTLNRNQKHLYLCSSNHPIPFYKFCNPKIKGKRETGYWKLDEKEASEFATLSNNQLGHTHIGFSSPPINSFHNRQNCEIEPYTLGVFIGDGCFVSERKSIDNPKNTLPLKSFRNRTYKRIPKLMKTVKMVSITTADFETIEEVSKYYPILRVQHKRDNKAKSFYFSINSNFTNLLTSYGFAGKKSGDKFIPKEALLSNIDYRMKLLAGLLDSDGYLSRASSYSYCTKSERLADDVVFLCHSLGCRAIKHHIKKGIKERNFTGLYFNVTITTGNIDIPQKVLRKKRKLDSNYIAPNRVSIKSSKTVVEMDVYGFTINSPSHWYIGDNFMVMGNSGKSLVAMSIGKEVFPEFSEKNMFFFDQEILDNAHTFPMNSILIRDENPQKAVFGLGSTRTSSQLGVLAETCRKYGLSVLFIEPSFVQDSISKILLETVDMDVTHRITRVALRDTYTLGYMGSIYVKVLEETDLDWIAYNIRKDQFIENIKKGQMAGAKLDYNDCVNQCMQCMGDDYNNKKERKALIRSKYPTYTNGEIDLISTLLEIELRKLEKTENAPKRDVLD